MGLSENFAAETSTNLSVLRVAELISPNDAVSTDDRSLTNEYTNNQPIHRDLSNTIAQDAPKSNLSCLGDGVKELARGIGGEPALSDQYLPTSNELMSALKQYACSMREKLATLSHREKMHPYRPPSQSLIQGEICEMINHELYAHAFILWRRMRSENGKVSLKCKSDDEVVAALSRKPEASMFSWTKALLRTRPDMAAARDMDGRTLLHVYCSLTQGKSAEELRFLISLYPEAIHAQDLEEQTPLHIFVASKDVRISLLRLLCADAYDSLGKVTAEGNTALHIFAANRCINLAVTDLLSATFPSALFSQNVDGSTPVNILSANPAINLELFTHMHCACEGAAKLSDDYRYRPLHTLCANPRISEELLCYCVKTFRSCFRKRELGGRLPLHLLCANENISLQLLSIAIEATPKEKWAAKDEEGGTSLHALCRNESIAMNCLEFLLSCCPESASIADQDGALPIHILCGNRAITLDLLTVLMQACSVSQKSADKRGRLAFHYLVKNPAISVELLRAMTEVCPEGTTHKDSQSKIPVQYLVENRATTEEMTSLLVDGGVLIRTRYAITAKGEPFYVASKRQHLPPENENASDSDVAAAGNVLSVTDFGCERNTSRPVVVKYYTSEAVRDHEAGLLRKLCVSAKKGDSTSELQEHLSIYETEDVLLDVFENNVNLRIQDTSSAHLQEYGMVMRGYSPSEVATFIMNDKVEKYQHLTILLYDILGVLHHWHSHARLVHGQLTLSSVITYAGYREHCDLLPNLVFTKPIGSTLSHSSTSPLITPPEVSNAIVMSNCRTSVGHSQHATSQSEVGLQGVVASPSIDLWQLGCTLYHLATGRHFLHDLLPWADSLSSEKLHRAVSIISQEAVDALIETLPSYSGSPSSSDSKLLGSLPQYSDALEFKLLLQKLLRVDPYDRSSALEIRRAGFPTFPHIRATKDYTENETAPLEGDRGLLSQQHTQQHLLPHARFLLSSEHVEKRELIEHIALLSEQLATCRLQLSLEREKFDDFLVKMKDEQGRLVQVVNDTSQTLQETTHACSKLQDECEDLRDELAMAKEALNQSQSELHSWQRKMKQATSSRQSLKDQLDASMQLINSLMPIVKKMYGSSAEEIISYAFNTRPASQNPQEHRDMSDRTTSAIIQTPDGPRVISSRLPIYNIRHSYREKGQESSSAQPSTVDWMKLGVKRRIAHTRLANSCLATWANSAARPPAVTESGQKPKAALPNASASLSSNAPDREMNQVFRGLSSVHGRHQSSEILDVEGGGTDCGTLDMPFPATGLTEFCDSSVTGGEIADGSDTLSELDQDILSDSQLLDIEVDADEQSGEQDAFVGFQRLSPSSSARWHRGEQSGYDYPEATTSAAAQDIMPASTHKKPELMALTGLSETNLDTGYVYENSTAVDAIKGRENSTDSELHNSDGYLQDKMTFVCETIDLCMSDEDQENTGGIGNYKQARAKRVENSTSTQICHGRVCLPIKRPDGTLDLTAKDDMMKLLLAEIDDTVY